MTTDKRPPAAGDKRTLKAPKWLNDDAKKIFKDSAKEIVELGISAKCDINVLAIFSMQMARLIELSQKQDRELPDNRMLNDLTTQTLQLMKELGLSPSARAKLRLAKTEDTSTFFELDEET